MQLSNPNARVFLPSGGDVAPGRITHLGIGAHQDDLEFMAYHGILACFDRDADWFGGVTCTDGAGSARRGPFAQTTDDALREIRAREQEAAAVIGRYGAMIQLGHTSATVRDPADPRLRSDLAELFRFFKPRVVYTHNLADKHDTHLGVVIATLQALRELPPDSRPEKVYGCEAWRGLDWMLDEDKTILDVSGREHLATALNGVFDSQIAGGKRYDLATIGRRRANATFLHAHQTDQAEMVSFAMDLTPLAHDATLSIVDYAAAYVRRLEADVRDRLTKRLE